MLNTLIQGRRPPHTTLPSRQRGVTLFIALISLVVMTLAAIGLMRSMGTSIFIAGNMAFKQSAIYAGDKGVEIALDWLAGAGGVALQSHIPSEGYRAIRQDPGVGESWDAFWNGTLAPGNMVLNVTNAALAPSDNAVAYIIQRMCSTEGPVTDAASACSTNLTGATSAGNSKGAGIVTLLGSSQVYYRVTVKTTGPRNTTSYIQTMVLL
mgnify:CR=1 FL=1